MSLTYHPFEDLPALDELGQSLRKNVSKPERLISAAFGFSLLGISRYQTDGLTKGLLLGAGAALLGRAWTGHCPLYEEIEVRQRRHKNASDEKGEDVSRAEA